MARLHSILLSLGLFTILLSPKISQAQEKCGVVEYEKFLHTKFPGRETEAQFEQWMGDKIIGNKLKGFQNKNSNTNRIESFTYTIPVVVHVIHNGEAVGSGTNISDAQIQSQIDVMNKDYNRLNTDAGSTPAEFLSVAGSLSIQFVLAKQDPEGLTTTGITRTLGTKSAWAITDNSELKALNYWPAENYLNIWVTNLSGSLLGYAQLPISTQLQGLENSSNDRLTDGVVVDYQAFGTIDGVGGPFNLLSAYNKGRTSTHEVGHFFGLRHIWGDDSNCATTTDYVDDTPSQDFPTNICPSTPQVSCSHSRMFQNYMDYTFDACMNLFTVGQVGRMVVILGNSPRRASLTISPGATAPTPLAVDLGIRQILSPTPSLCNNPVIPQIEVRNYGTNPVTDTQIKLILNSTIIETKTFAGLALANLQTTTLSFSTLTFTPSSSQQVSFLITQTNGATDPGSTNNSASVTVQVPVSASLPIVEPFNTTPTSWQIVNPDGDITWANVVAPDFNPANRAMFMNFHAYQNEGATDWLITPSFNISTPLTSQLKFDVAYAQYPGQTGEGLKVYALPGCNTDLTKAILLYNKSDALLATAPSTTNSFTPSSDAQWRKSEVISLSNLSNSSTYQLAFIATNGYGNNLFVDNAVVSDKIINDLALTGVISPSLVHCVSAPSIQFNVKNQSTSPVTSFQVERILNDGTSEIQTFPASLLVGEQKTFSLNTLSLSKGVNKIKLTILNPNTLPDSDPSNNSLTFNTYLDQSSDSSPLRQTFDSNLEVPWLLANPFNAKPWQQVPTNKNLSVVYKAFSNTTQGEESWVASPVLDLSRFPTTSLLFDVSYAQRPPANDHLRIVASDDCGLTYTTVLFDAAGSEFSTVNSTAEWIPASNTDWKRQFVNLSALAGKKNIRLALIATNANGNNLYLDNLEIFAGDDSNPPVTSVPYQLYYSNKVSQSDLALTFNLPEKKDVQLQIFTVMGQIVADNLLPETLNQTYYFDLSIQSSGLYIFRLQIDGVYSSTKVFIGH